MKQIMQNLGDGKTFIIEAPCPKVSKNHILINTRTSLISAGTERMLVGFGKASYLQKARTQPEKVKMVLEKVTTDGIGATLDAVKSKLAQPIPLGYCNVGVVSSIGDGVVGLSQGDRVVSNGSHADVVKVPKNLCVKIPDQVDDETASFVVVGSIGLQGVRLAQPTLGECVVVVGAGLIGLLTVQLLRAQGCRVLAIDFDQSKLDLARQFGAETCNLNQGEDPVEKGMSFSRGCGVDAVIITAATNSHEPIRQAAEMSRKRGRIVLVGVVGLNLNRAEFYEKELTFQVSCSYGPGRYDVSYEDMGNDYPLPFVRWTEQRNFEAVLDMMASGQINVKPLISKRFAFEDAQSAYKNLTENNSDLGVILEYESHDEQRHVQTIALEHARPFNTSEPRVSFIGAGNYASRMLIPAFKKAGAQLHTLSSSGGVSGTLHGTKSGFSQASTDTGGLLNDKDVDAVVIVTRHNTHVELVDQALKSGKHVFVEKPLAIDMDGLSTVQDTYQAAHINCAGPQLMIGFNRRFSPLVQKMKDVLQTIYEPKSFIMTMNAGVIPPDHWTQDHAIGGGRIIGEACHYIDLMRYLAGSDIISVQARRMGDHAGIAVTEDKASITLGFADGSFGTIFYLANGSAKYPKERIEVFTSGKVLKIDNFRSLTGFGWKNFKKMRLWRQDKGQVACAQAFLAGLKDGEQAIPINEIFEVTRISIEISDMLRNQK